MVYGKRASGNIESLIRLVKWMPIIPLDRIYNKRSFLYIDNLCHLLKAVIMQRKSGLFIASDDDSISTSTFIELIANGMKKNIYLIKIPFFECLLKLLMPSLHRKLFMSLEIDNSKTK